MKAIVEDPPHLTQIPILHQKDYELGHIDISVDMMDIVITKGLIPK